jgi:hypothetical protein
MLSKLLAELRPDCIVVTVVSEVFSLMLHDDYSVGRRSKTLALVVPRPTSAVHV